MTNGRGFKVISECIGDKSHDNGHLLILRYILSLFENACDPVTSHLKEADEYLDLEPAMKFRDHACIVESEQGIEVHGLIEKTILRLPYSQQLAFTEYMLEMVDMEWTRGCLKLKLFTLYIHSYLYKSGIHYLEENRADIAEDICSFLLDFDEPEEGVVKVLAEDFGKDDIELVDELVRDAISRREIELFHREEALRLWNLVADKIRK
jgi:hypothetical protein